MLETFVPGNPENLGLVCITSETRPYPGHAWARAALHIMRFDGLPFFARLEASSICCQVVDAANRIPRPPQRVPVKWGWGKGWPGIRA